ncbi:SRPBCC family protein [Undibacterium hunanense]|uniref:hypothetical protein n=1 Tax=Undibacterium hunanense TaxID=2762292 RepID=UPI001C9A8169|nr:hypothetical protein [Undibacterium hunanense]
MNFTSISFAFCALFFVTSHTSAEVINISPNGFLIRHEVQLNVPAEQAYDQMVNQVSTWWNPSHTYSQNAKNLSIDARPGGCFCEKLPNGGGVQHLSVVYVAPGKTLRMTGALGPMQGSGLAGSMTWDFSAIKATETGKALSKLVLTYSVGGYMPAGFDKMAPAADGMLGEQLTRYKNLVNTGKPD